jgi:hypothetical protein
MNGIKISIRPKTINIYGREMKTKLCAFLLTSFILITYGCKKDENPTNTTEQFSNKIALGTGIGGNGFQLVGEGTTFTGVSNQIYFRLESQADMEGSQIKIKLEKNSGTGFAFFNDYTFNNPQSYGHIFLSSFSPGQAGNYKATGIIVSKNLEVASLQFTLN